MNKREFIDHMSAEHGFTNAEAERIINTFITSVTSSLRAGNEISLTGFGAFSLAKVAARNGRNPKTGERITIAAYNQPKFKAGKILKEACNGDRKK